MRGGAWVDSDVTNRCRSAARCAVSSSESMRILGFRLVRTAR
ncbi:hypothetical protein GF402_11880 [Candidatus Fermentibacteria bacterium]|nr:hypothetical protein [Candidatus Fermentibacteria bacterium]